WARDERAPSPRHAARLTELTELVDRLTSVIDPDYIAQWLRRPVPALDDARPIDVLAAGDLDRVSRVIAALESPVAS
ncbi:MAG TPA: antitoxin Xre/MbcA/ParS toxin-binding domain-containing protein, partial [Acidimicrobiales bacterium]